MKNETLKKAQDLERKIDKLERIIRVVESHNHVNFYVDIGGCGYSLPDCVDMQIVKNHIAEESKKTLEKLQKEFEDL